MFKEANVCVNSSRRVFSENKVYRSFTWFLLPRSPNDKNYANAIVHALTNLLNKEAQGQIMIEQLSQAGQVMTAKAPEFEADISGSTDALRKQFAELFAEISRQNGQLSDVMAHFRDFKVSYS